MFSRFLKIAEVIQEMTILDVSNILHRILISGKFDISEAFRTQEVYAI